MLIAQITDTHITETGELLAGRIDSASALARAVDRMRALDARPDCLLVTGDLSDHGTPQSYALFRRLVDPLGLALYAIPGNHDRREALRDAFRDCAWMPRQAETPLCYQFEVGEFIVIALDTLVEGEDYGMLGDVQLDWLDARLARAAGRRVIVMLHHPPVNSGIAVMDAMKLRDAECFGAVIERHPNIERVLCGHLHRCMHVRWRGTVVSIASSPVEQLQLDFDPSAALAAVQEPPGFLLHYGDPVDGLISHNVPIGSYPGPFLY